MVPRLRCVGRGGKWATRHNINGTFPASPRRILFLYAMSGWLTRTQIIPTSQSVWQQDLIGTDTSTSTSTSGVGNTPPFSWRSVQFRTLVLGSAVPSVVVLLIFTYDLLSAIQLPKGFKKLLRILASPFTNFLSLDDLEDEPGPTYVPPLWKIRAMAILSAIQAVAWAAFFCYAEVVGDLGEGWGFEAGVGFMSWVGRSLDFLGAWNECPCQSYVLLRLLFKAPGTVPYALLLFCLVHSLVASVDLAAITLDDELNSWVFLVTLLRLGVPLFVVWVAGTFKMEATLSSTKVATGKDVSGMI